MTLQVQYLGFTLRSPLVAGASPLSSSLSGIQQLEQAGAAAIVLPSLFEEQIVKEAIAEKQYTDLSGKYAKFSTLEDYYFSPESYLHLIREAKNKVQIPIIASLNGKSPGWWCRFAKKIEEAGADALELNIFWMPTDMDQSADSIEMFTLDIVRLVRQEIQIPLAVKISPFYTNVGNMAKRFQAAGANGLVLFNRFMQPGINTEKIEVKSQMLLGTSRDTFLSLRWIGILFDRLKVDLAATGGVIEPNDAIQLILVGATVVMLCSALLKKGPEHLNIMEKGLVNWMDKHGYSSLEEWRGLLSQKRCPDPETFERAQYINSLILDREKGNEYW